MDTNPVNGPLPQDSTPVMPPAPPASPEPVPPANDSPKQSNTGLIVVVALVLVALAVLAGVTYVALQSNNQQQAKTASEVSLPPATTKKASPSAQVTSDQTSQLQSDFNSLSVDDPTSSVDSLDSDINQL